MKAAQVRHTTGPDGIQVVDLDAPAPAQGEVLVDVHAVGVSYPDLLLSKGEYQIKPDLPFIIGVDFAGVLRADVPDHGLAAGDRVAGWSTHGGAAEVVSAAPERLFPLHHMLSFEQAAGMPLNYLTAHFALTIRGAAGPGDWVQINGAAGGVGSAALQVARGLGCRVVAMVASESEAEFVRRYEPTAVLIGPSNESVREITAGAGLDVVLDVVGTDTVVTECLRSLAVGGRLLSLGYVGGSIPSVRLNRLLLGNLDVRGVAWGPYTRTHEGFARRQWDELMGMLERGLIPAPSNRVLGLEDFGRALSELAEGRAPGKTVLRVR
jgi:NADPH2:quinone reductase